MEKNEILKEANEALQRTLLMMNYDMKKTLSENVDVISEQGNEDQEIANLLYAGAHGSPGTKVDKLVSGFSKIKNADQYNRVEKLYASAGREKTLQDMLRSELGSGDTEDLEKIKASLSKAGVNLTYKDTFNMNFGVPSKNVDSDTITISPIKTNKSWDSDLRSLTKQAKKQEPGTVSGVPSLKVTYPNSFIQFAQNNRYFQYTPSGTLAKKGSWKIKNGKLFTTPDDTKKEVEITNKKTNIPAVTDDKILSTLNFEYKFPGDTAYVYDFVPNSTVTEDTNQGGTWYAKNVKTGKVFNISQYYPKTVEKLNTQFPSAANPVDKSPKNLNTTSSNVSDIQGKKLEVQPVGSKFDPTQKINLTTTTTTVKPVVTQTTPDMSDLDLYGPSGMKENLKKTLKKNLMLVKENKENLMVETNIVEKRFNFIVEGKTFDSVEDQDKLIESVISEIGYLKNQGYSSKAINEGLFSFFGSLLGGGAKAVPAVFGEYIANWLTGMLKIPKNSYMNGVIVSLVGNLNISDYDRFFSDCRFASNKIADSLIEGYLLQLQNQKDVNSGASGFIVSALRNSVVDYFAEDKNSLIQILEDKIGEFLCPKLSKLSGVISDKTDEIKAKMVA